MNKIICFFRGHRRKECRIISSTENSYTWRIRCGRCGFEIEYVSPHARLVGTEMQFGFDGI